MNVEILVLLKDLPCCPAGRIFKSTNDGLSFYHYMTDDEVINSQLKDYTFSRRDVESNPSWFRWQTVNDNYLVSDSTMAMQVLRSLANRTGRSLDEVINEMEARRGKDEFTISDLDLAGVMYGEYLC